MNKLKLSVGILAFVGLAALNFTQSESCFVSKALASSSGSTSSGGFLASVSSWWDSKVYDARTVTKTRNKKFSAGASASVPVKGVIVGGHVDYEDGTTETYTCNECVSGSTYAHCWDIPNRC